MDGDVQLGDLLPEDIAVVGLGSFEAAQIQVSAVGLVPGIATQEGSFIPVEMDPADARFTQVIQGGPYEVADDIRVLRMTLIQFWKASKGKDSVPTMIRSGRRLWSDRYSAHW